MRWLISLQKSLTKLASGPSGSWRWRRVSVRQLLRRVISTSVACCARRWRSTRSARRGACPSTPSRARRSRSSSSMRCMTSWRGEVPRSWAGVGEELAPELLGGQDLREVTSLLLLGAVRDERRPDQVHADPVDDLGRARGGDLLLEDVVLDDRGAAPTVLARPVDADPAALVQLPLPAAQEGDLVGEGRVLGGRRDVRAEPFAQLGAEGLLGGREGEIHERTCPRGRRRVNRAHRARRGNSSSTAT